MFIGSYPLGIATGCPSRYPVSPEPSVKEIDNGFREPASRQPSRSQANHGSASRIQSARRWRFRCHRRPASIDQIRSMLSFNAQSVPIWREPARCQPLQAAIRIVPALPLRLNSIPIQGRVRDFGDARWRTPVGFDRIKPLRVMRVTGWQATAANPPRDRHTQ